MSAVAPFFAGPLSIVVVATRLAAWLLLWQVYYRAPTDQEINEELDQ